jgi:anti-sigma regulatory factor (Ser/Thr protein kinase)
VNAVRRIERDACPEQLPALLEFIERACARADLPQDVASAVRLAAEEACLNVIRHGYRGVPAGPVAVGIAHDASRVVVTIEDRGAPFDPADVPPPPLDAPAEDRPLGGLGWHLIRQVMDEVHHAHDARTGNRLTLVKHIPTPAYP